MCMYIYLYLHKKLAHICFKLGVFFFFWRPPLSSLPTSKLAQVKPPPLLPFSHISIKPAHPSLFCYLSFLSSPFYFILFIYLFILELLMKSHFFSWYGIYVERSRIRTTRGRGVGVGWGILKARTERKEKKRKKKKRNKK